MNNVNLASYTDDTTIYDTKESIDNVIMSLQKSAKKDFSGIWIVERKEVLIMTLDCEQ